MKHKLMSFLAFSEDELHAMLPGREQSLEISRIGTRGENTDEEVLAAVRDASLILFFPGSPHMSREIIEAAKELKFIQSTVVGYDNIDLEAATGLGIPVANNPGWNTRAVAEHTIMVILMCLRNILDAHNRTVEQGWMMLDWMKFADGNREFEGKTLGIIGFGATGREVAKLARVFDPRILYYKRNRLSVAEEKELGVEYRSFTELLAESDIVSLHVPLTDETRGMIGRDEIALMKDEAIFINVAREGIVDEAAIAEALQNGKLSSAAFDVVKFKIENRVRQPDTPLTDCKNVIISPHTAGPTREARERAVAQWTVNVCRFLDGDKPRYLVNDVWNPNKIS